MARSAINVRSSNAASGEFSAVSGGQGNCAGGDWSWSGGRQAKSRRGTGPLDLVAYCALGHVLVSTSGGSFHGFIDEQLEPLGYERNVALSVHQFILAPMVVERR